MSELREIAVSSSPPDVPIGRAILTVQSNESDSPRLLVKRPAQPSVPVQTPTGHKAMTNAPSPQFMVYVEGEEFGPIDQKDLQLWAYEQRIEPGTLVRLSTSDQWMPARQFSVRFPESQPSQQPGSQHVQQTIVIQNAAPVLNVASVANVSRPSYETHRESSTNNGVAAICSFLFPGLGQFVQGRAGAGIGFMLGTIVGMFLFVFPGAMIWLWSVIDAAVYKPPRRRLRY